jgi:DNA-binding response OmpR family regulator
MTATKNISRRKLLQVLGSSAFGSALAPFASMMPAPLELEKLTAARPIVWVDDDKYLLEGWYDIMRLENIHTIPCLDPRDAFNICLTEPVSMLVSDIVMPHMDGYGLVRKLRLDARTRNLPFMFVTPRGEAEAVQYGYCFGASAYVVLPCTPEEIIRIIRHLLMTRVKW